MPDWQRWGGPDPVAEKTGISFDRTPAGEIRAPEGRFRVTAWHIDFDERPTCYVDVDTLDEAKRINDDLSNQRDGWNVDYASVWDDRGEFIYGGPPWAEKKD